MPRIKHLIVEGLRVLEKVGLELHPLNVLIGESGAGKTSIVEACELLRKAGSARVFLEEVYRYHGGQALLRSPAGRLTLTVTIEDGAGENEREYEYSLSLEGSTHGQLRVVAEHLSVVHAGHSDAIALQRDQKAALIWNPRTGGLAPMDLGSDTLLLSIPQREAGPDPVGRVRQILSSILIYMPLDTSALWSRKDGEPARGPRSTVVIRPATVVERGGDNLPSAYHTIRDGGQAAWNRVIELIRLGLGDDVDDLLLPSDPGGGQISLALRIRGVGVVSSRLLSDGQLAYLTFVAILHLQPPECPLVVFDEPDHHLHPDLVRRVMGILQELSDQRTVLATTHSDRLIDLIEDPAGSVILLSAPEHRTVAQRPDPEALEAWLKDYRGIGALRADGVASMVFPPEH